jgi:hypothetical protein
MNGTHPTAAQLDRYRRRTASPAEMLAVDAHIAACDRCFEALSADAHLTFDQLVAITEGHESGSPHLALCPMCRRELEDLQRLREVMRGPTRSPRRRWMLAAAMVSVAVATWIVFQPEPRAERRADFSLPPDRLKPVVRSAPPSVLQRPRILDTLVTETAVLRGPDSSTSFALHAPVATVVLDDRPQLRWAGVGSSYEITILDIENGTVAASGTSTTNAWRPNALKRGRTYAWQVAAQTPEGRVIAPGRGGEARFHVATERDVEGNTPLERGIALANLGALDDAERELEAANADALLEQVRAWRAQRGRPTTTNGAQ